MNLEHILDELYSIPFLRLIFALPALLADWRPASLHLDIHIEYEKDFATTDFEFRTMGCFRGLGH